MRDQNQDASRHWRITLQGAVVAGLLGYLVATLFQPAFAQVLDMLP